MKRICQKLILAFMALGGMACLVASIIWLGCANSPGGPGGGGNYQSSAPATGWSGVGTPPTLRNPRFRENVLFLQQGSVPVAEVYASFGPPDWESKELRLIAYRARNGQALLVTYGTNQLVTRHAVKSLKATDSLAESAQAWRQSGGP